jgi:gliding motility-associated protein GldM
MSLSLPKPPRQKMINLLYIVLTAMLALNVSAEILNAFKTVNESIHHSNLSIDQKNAIIYQQFEKQMQQDPAKVGPLRERAQQVKLLCAQTNAYIDSLKNRIVTESGGRDDSGEIVKMDDLDAASRIMENQRNGAALQARLEDLRTKLLAFFPASARASAEKTLPLVIEMPPHTEKKTWSQANFDMVPTIAAVTILSKYQNDIKNSEAQVIDYLYSQINAQQFTLDTYKPLVSANSGYIMEGQKYQAQIMLGAYSSTVNPTITVNGQPIEVNNGVGTFTAVGSGVGEHTYNVNVSLKDRNGQVKTFTTTGSYMVGASSLSVSADKMNVLFIGLDNPISIAAAGVPAESVTASISQGSLSKTGTGRYTARVTTVGNASVSVSARVGDQVRNLGTMQFRVMRVPDPVAEVGGSKGGRMSAAVFRVQQGVAAVLENFYFDTKFVITHFTIGFDGTGFTDYLERQSNSALFTGDIKALMQQCRPGSRVFIDEIRAKAPDGTTRNLPSIAFKLY